jgi:hypothetical protein
MKRSAAVLAVFVICAVRSASAATCAGFSIVPGDHVMVRFSTSLPSGATVSSPVVSISGLDVAVTRNVSGGSAITAACVDDLVDLGYLGAGRFNLAWTDNINFTSQRSAFTFFVGTPAAGTVDETSVLLPVLPTQPLRLEVNACSQRPAVAYRSGNDILISQYGSGTTCKIYVLDFGVLPEGTYNVRTTRLDATSGPSSTSFSFIVQQPGPESGCSDRSSITPTERGTARLNYEVPYRGFRPTFGPPAVTEIGTYIDPDSKAAWPLTTILGPVSDTADSTKLVSGFSNYCRGENLDIGIPVNGYNEIRWYDQVSVNGVVVGFKSTGTSVGFQWAGGAVQCSSFPRAIIPSPALEGPPIDLGLSTLGGFNAVPAITVYGRNYFIELVLVPQEGPIPTGPPRCRTYSVNLGPLSAGLYSISWGYMGGGSWHPISNSLFTVIKPPRQRAARH